MYEEDNRTVLAALKPTTLLAAALKAAGHEVVDFGAHALVAGDDYPDFVVPLARALARGEFIRGIAVCGSGIGASVAANNVVGVRRMTI